MTPLDLKQSQVSTFWHKAQQDCNARSLASSDTGDKYLRGAVAYLKQVLRGIHETDLGWCTLGAYALSIQIHQDPERVTPLLSGFFGAGHLVTVNAWNGDTHVFTIDLEPVIILEDEEETDV